MANDFYTVTTPAANQPILFADADAWCRDIDAADTALVNTLIVAATKLIEDMTNRVYVQRTFTGEFQCLSESSYENFLYVQLRRAPLISVTTVKVNTVLVAGTEYIQKDTSSFSRMLFKTSQVLDTDYAYPIEVVFVAGYATVPDAIITAIQQLVLFWYENRGDVSPDRKQVIPFVVRSIINQYRIINTFG